MAARAATSSSKRSTGSTRSSIIATSSTSRPRAAAAAWAQPPIAPTAAAPLLADLPDVGRRAVLARGGNGGFGNAHFKSSTNRAPRHANPGQPGEEFIIRLRLKLIADAGHHRPPNA